MLLAIGRAEKDDRALEVSVASMSDDHDYIDHRVPFFPSREAMRSFRQ
jgi:hypothetical protein